MTEFMITNFDKLFCNAENIFNNRSLSPTIIVNLSYDLFEAHQNNVLASRGRVPKDNSLPLGHSQLEGTSIYARADIEMKRKAFEKIDS